MLATSTHCGAQARTGTEEPKCPSQHEASHHHFPYKKAKCLLETHLKPISTSPQRAKKKVKWIQPYLSHTPPQGAGWLPAKGDFGVGSDPSQEPTPGEASLGICSDRTSAEQFKRHLQYALLHTHADKRITESCWFGLVFFKL